MAQVRLVSRYTAKLLSSPGRTLLRAFPTNEPGTASEVGSRANVHQYFLLPRLLNQQTDAIPVFLSLILREAGGRHPEATALDVGR